MNRFIYIIPVLAFGALAYLLFHSLSAPAPDQLPSALLDKPAPPLSLPALDGKTKALSRADLVAGHVTVLNVWASWCAPCREEASMLTQLSGRRDIELDGLVYKDSANNARAFLEEVGNPFARIDIDSTGRAAIDWGVYDVPETFVIDGRGVVRMRFSGPITPDVLSSTLLPAIENAKGRRS
jgi:cytochrome c biogenesis protein CcmG/thiol:disulfide interchange protein DsbE